MATTSETLGAGSSEKALLFIETLHFSGQIGIVRESSPRMPLIQVWTCSNLPSFV